MLITPGVPQTTARFGPIGTREPITFETGAAPAAAGIGVTTPEALSGANTQVFGSPGQVVAMPAPLVNSVLSSTPLESQPGAHSPQVVSNQRLVTPPSNTLITPRIRPPKFVDPPVQRADAAASNAAAFSRGNLPRSVVISNGTVTASPQVVTRWATYGA